MSDDSPVAATGQVSTAASRTRRPSRRGRPEAASANSNFGPIPSLGPKQGHILPPLPDDLDTDDALRRFTALRLAEHLNVGVELVAELKKAPAFSAEDRVHAVLASARVLNASARLGRTIGYLSRTEQRHKTIIERVQSSDTTSNDSILKMERKLLDKMVRYMNVVADETFDPALKQAEAKTRKTGYGQTQAHPGSAAPAD